MKQSTLTAFLPTKAPNVSKKFTDSWKGKRKSDPVLYSNSFQKNDPRRRSDNVGLSTSSTLIPKNPYIGGIPLIPETLKKPKEECENNQIRLSTRQHQVLFTIMNKNSVFFTGAAGTGKSFIIKVLQDVMEHLGKSDKIAFTAPTGVAACNIRGMTIHSWAGIGLAKDPLHILVGRVHSNRDASKRWKETEILVIDEVSMLSSDILEALSEIGKRIRNNPKPFGGLQVILCGDFFQLPPVGLSNKVKFCFESEIWNELFDHENGMIVLDKVFRQKDNEFVRLLNELRRGEVSSTTNSIILKKIEQQKKSNENNNNIYNNTEMLKHDDNIVPTKLFSTNKDVNQMNLEELLKLPSDDCFKYEVKKIEGSERDYEQLKANCRAPELLELRLGSQVMLLKNKDTASGLVNGARGVVVGFDGRNRGEPYPLVRFSSLSEAIVIERDTWDIRSGDRTLAILSQVPLMLAWAVSMHKAQGMTIPLLQVSFNGIFEYGQAYVALSRATDLQGLSLTGTFRKEAVKAHPQVKQFYNRLGYVAESVQSEESVVTTSVELLAATYTSESQRAEAAGSDGDADEDEWIRPKSAPAKRFVPHAPVVPTPSSVEPLVVMKEVSVPTREVFWVEEDEELLIKKTKVSNASLGQVPTKPPPPLNCQLNDETRRRIEENRQKALRRQEEFRLEREAEVNSLIGTLQSDNWGRYQG